MKLSRETDYAFRALFNLVDEYGKDPVSIRELAEGNDIPKRFLEQIMLVMKRQGWVASGAGRHGGYFLARPPDMITMGEVCRHFDGYLAPLPCVSVTEYSPCTQERRCRFRRVMLRTRNMVAHLMDGLTLADVANESPVTKREVLGGFSKSDRT